MANLDAPTGLTPIVGTYRPPQRYPITASYATALFVGDPVVQVAAGTIERATAAANNQILGAIMGFEKVGEGPQNYFAASSSGTWYALVCDDPDALYEIQEDGDTTPLTTAARGANANLVIGTGSTVTGLSAAEIDSDSVGTSTSQQLRLIGYVDAIDNAVDSAYAKWIVRINYAQLSTGTVGAGV